LAFWRRLAAAFAVVSALAAPSLTTAETPAAIHVGQTSAQELVAGALRVHGGDFLHYQVVLSGDPRRDAYGLRVTETWPDGLEFIDASADPAAAAVFDPAKRELIWFADAPAGSKAVLDVTARVLSSAMGETLEGSRALSGGDALVDEPPPIAVQSAANVDLAVSGTSSRTRTGEFFEITYAMTIINNGPDPATAVMLEVVIDPITFDEVESGFFNNVPAGACDIDALLCDFGDLGVGESIDFEAVAQVHIDSTPISIPFDFRVTSNDTDIDQTNNQVFVSEALPEVESDDGGGALGPGFLLALLLLRRRKALATSRAQPG
jgi:hypothetical protein